MPVRILVPQLSEMEKGHTLRFNTSEGATGYFTVISVGFTTIKAEHPGGGEVTLKFTNYRGQGATAIYPGTVLSIENPHMTPKDEEIHHCWHNGQQMF